MITVGRRAFLATVFAGGVSGIQDLLDPSNSRVFRQRGGGLYLHSTGWGKLSEWERTRVLQIFQGQPIAIELGFGNGDAWGRMYAQLYGRYQLTPKFIAVNAFDKGGRPALDEWRRYIVVVRQYGAPPSTPIMTVLAPNRRPVDLPVVSASPNLQSFITEGGGIVLDTPPKYAVDREPEYRQWVLDAIRWATQRRLRAVIILSPWSSRMRWTTDTDQFLRFLRDNGAAPSDFVCENYVDNAPSDYPNRIGSDAIPYSAIGNCDRLL